MLKNDFYTIVEPLQAEENSFQTSISLNAGHSIFAGHFPGFPIMPGVCAIAIIRELLELHLGRSLIMQSVSNIKFLTPINPVDNSNVQVKIQFTADSSNAITADGSVFKDSLVFFKITKAIYR